MTTSQFIAFLAAILLLYMTPGPAMVLLAQTTMRHGARGALVTTAALNAGEALLVFAAAAGLAIAANIAQPLFASITWVGLAYLVWRACKAWHDLVAPPHHVRIAAPRDKAHLALPGFAVAFSNPTTLIFFTALLPQFVMPGADQSAQLFLLAATYVATVIVLDLALVLAVARIARQKPVRISSRVGSLCNALALTAIAAFVMTHAVTGVSPSVAWPAHEAPDAP